MKRYLPVAIFILIILIIAIIAFIITDANSSVTAGGNISSNSQSTNLTEENDDEISNINQRWVKGDPNAKVQILEYSDFQCPYCSKGKDTVDKIYEKYSKDVSVTFLHIPLTSIHPYALPAAKAAEAAGYQGKFWEMHDLLFANQSNLAPADLETYAKKLDLDLDQFKRYINNSNIAEKISNQSKEISGKEFDEIALDEKGNIVSKGKAKIEGTPAFLINGKLVVGAYPFEKFEKFVQAALNGKL